MRSICLSRLLAATVGFGVLAGGVSAQAPADVTGRIGPASALIKKHLDLLGSSDSSVRLAAFQEMVRSGDPTLAEAAVGAGLQSADPALRALGLRTAFRQVRALMAKLDAGPNAEAAEVVKLCGNAVQYAIGKYDYAFGSFEARGQDHVGNGNISGDTISITIEYGCSFSGRLQKDGSVEGVVSAPYKKGSLAARMMLR